MSSPRRGRDEAECGSDEEPLREGSLVDLRQDPLLLGEEGGEALIPPDAAFYRPAAHPLGAQQMEEAVGQMEVAWGRLKGLGLNPAWEPPDEDPEQWLLSLKRDLPEPEAFKAGRLGAHAGVWEKFFQLAGNRTKAAKQVVRWLRDGVFCPFVAIDHPGQEAAPFHKKKLEIVRAMLRRAVPVGADVDSYLRGKKPQAVVFPNHQSTVTYGGFLREELEGMLRKGVVKEWAAPEPPVVVNGLRVVDDKAPKLRLCINPMYVNLFTKYQPVQYERLSDIPHLATEGDYAFTTDDKSGYWQCPLHPAMWKYMAFAVEGRTFCFTHLPFGLAPACYVYTAIKQEIYRPLREAGLKLVFLIDDQMSMQRGVARTRWQCGAMCRLLVALGWVLSVPKCQLEPSQLPRFLGMLADLADRAFRIPADKQQHLRELFAELAGGSSLSDRHIARMAGKVMALAPALELAPLMARAMMKAMQGQLGWDQIYPTPAAFKADMELMLELMAASDGKKWSLRTEVVQVVGDASESALAAFTPNGELEAPIIVPFTEEERRAVMENQWSSTARELSVLEKVVATMEEQRPGLLRGRRLQYATDSQPGMQALMGMKGSQNTFPIVKVVRLLCASVGTELEVVWRPREHELQQQADDYTKMEDANDWSLNPDVYRMVLEAQSLGGLRPSIDVFASPTNSKVEGAYFSLYLGPGCKGIDAFTQPWGRDRETGRRQLAFINGPFQKMGQILRKVIQERVDCIIVAPMWPRPWTALWRQMPVRERMPLPHREDLFLPGSMVAAQERRPKAPRYSVSAYVVLW